MQSNYYKKDKGKVKDYEFNRVGSDRLLLHYIRVDSKGKLWISTYLYNKFSRKDLH